MLIVLQAMRNIPHLTRSNIKNKSLTHPLRCSILVSAPTVSSPLFTNFLCSRFLSYATSFFCLNEASQNSWEVVFVFENNTQKLQQNVMV